MDSGEIAEVKITFETQIQDDLIVGFLLREVFTVEGVCMLFLSFLTWFTVLYWIKSFPVYPHEPSQFSAFCGSIDHVSIYFSGIARGLKTFQVINGICLLKSKDLYA